VGVALTEGWYVDGEPVQAFGRIIEDRSGWEDVPAMRGSNVTLLGAHGDSWRRKRYDAGNKPLVIGVHGCDTTTWEVPSTGTAERALYESNLEGLLRLLAPRAYRQLDVTRVYADGSRRRAWCEVTGAITPDDAGNGYGQVSLELVVPGAFWEDVDEATYRLPYDTTLGGTQTLEVFSLAGQTAPCSDAQVTITGPCTSVTLVDSQTGSGFSYSSSLSSGDVLAVDAGAFTAALNPTGANTNVITSLGMFDQQILEVVPASESYRGPTVDVTPAGVSAGFTVTFVTKRKWLR
jgi:hypothetical protein